MPAIHELGEAQHHPIDQLNAFIGNSEKKCVIQLLAEPGETLTAQELLDRFTSLQAQPATVTYKSKNNLPQMVNRSHAQVDAYASSLEVQFSTWIATKNPDSDTADALTGHNLAIADDYDISLEKLWGKTSTKYDGNMRSPRVRLKLFKVLQDLDNNQSLNIKQLATEADLNPSFVHTHITRLHESGFVEYTASQLTQIEKPSFEIVGNPDPTLSTSTNRGTRQRKTQYYRGDLSVRTQLGYKLMDFQQAGITTFSYDDVRTPEIDDKSAMLEYGMHQLHIGIMVREGILKRIHRTVSAGDTFSEVQLNPTQREIMQRIVQVYDGLRGNSMHVIQKGLELGAEILADTDTVTRLLQRGHTVSPQVNKLPYPIHATNIGSMLLNTEMSTRQVQQQYDEGRLSISSVYGILRKMKAAGVLSSRSDGIDLLWADSKS